ncbi:MAG: hypothetical protein ACXWDO_01560 [Bacteroidia bacterium]
MQSSPVRKDRIQGRWIQIGVATGPLNQYIYRFYGDSFKIEKYSFTDIILPYPCNYKNWWNYAKGTYLINNNILQLEGIYTDSNFNKIDSVVCPEHFKAGNYEMQLKGHFVADTLNLEITGGDDYMQRTMHTIKFRRE